MKTLESLSKYFIVFLFIFVFLLQNLFAEEAVDIWKIDNQNKIEEENNSEIKIEEPKENSIYQMQSENKLKIINEEKTLLDPVKLAGIFDPQEYGLSLEMWSNSNGKIIKSILTKLNKMNLSEDSKEILRIALLTNSYLPNKNITQEEFLDFKKQFLFKEGDLNLIKTYLINNNSKTENNDSLIRFFADKNLSSSELEKACSIFDHVDYIFSDYLSKFKIYCLFNSNKSNEAQLFFDLKKELGMKDIFFENKFNFLMGYNFEDTNEISEKNILNFHLSHRTNKEFLYTPNEKTSKIIWRYLSTSNLLEETTLVDIENIDKIKLIEKATHEKNYKEEDLLELYKRFQFNINQLLNAGETFKLLPSYQGRALLYQKLLLSSNSEERLYLSSKLKESFIADELENAFNLELSKILKSIDTEEIPSNYSLFYNKYLIAEEKKEFNIKFNNKIVHQSKLLNYFTDKKDIGKVQKETNDILKKMKKNKKYFFSTKDIILLESLKSDGVEIDKKNKDIYEYQDPDIPYDIQIMIRKKETGLMLLRLVEIIGEDQLNDLGTETLYFIVSALNQLNLDPIRDKILLKVLPLKV
tara:strand:- start:293 stop:2044 length:1752 start_codon:yes stop_codon:yes gene_type:complete